MFTKRFVYALIAGILLIIIVLFGKTILHKVSGTNNIATLIESDTKSIEFYKKACEFEDGEVCNELGDIYHYGKDVYVNHEEAVKYYTKACELENGPGCNNLAYMLNQGLGIKKNNWNALRLYKKACKYKEMEACYNVGSMYFHGEGSKRNYYNAKFYFEKACNNPKVRIGAACNDLAYMYEHGKYVRRNLGKAMSLYSDACDMGEASGCNNLAHIHEARHNDVSAQRFYSKACDLGDTPSCNRLESVLGKKILAIKNEVDLKEAKNACNISTKGGTMCYKVGLYYESKGDNELARQYFEKACDRGQSQSCKHLGDLFRQK